ncbi:hypothetical protein [Amycolatopsis speibonae]|uniref:Uncharacterized protein n=1 Tax=Amycolatopsis speibonae TaxID=1450224 RepID=A0ABV7PDL3_9PSEU
MSIRRPAVLFAASVAVAALLGAPAHAAPLTPVQHSSVTEDPVTEDPGCAGEDDKGLCPIPQLGIAKSSMAVSVGDTDTDGDGAQIEEFVGEGPTAVPALHKFDVIGAIYDENGPQSKKRLEDPDMLMAELAKYSAGEKVKFYVWGGSKASSFRGNWEWVTVTLLDGTRPATP